MKINISIHILAFVLASALTSCSAQTDCEKRSSLANDQKKIAALIDWVDKKSAEGYFLDTKRYPRGRIDLGERSLPYDFDPADYGFRKELEVRLDMDEKKNVGFVVFIDGSLNALIIALKPQGPEWSTFGIPADVIKIHSPRVGCLCTDRD